MPFLQVHPRVKNTYTNDIVLHEILQAYLPTEFYYSLREEFSSFGNFVTSPKVFSWVDNAEANPPEVEQYDAFGNRVDKLKTSEGWRKLRTVAAEEGIISIAHEGTYGEYSRIIQFAKYYIYSPSSALFTCPLAMTDAAASLLRLYEPKHPAINRLTSRDPRRFWTSGQWMTETAGGSDVSQSESTAKFDGKDWRINGFKWFSSATDSEMAILLAKTDKGLSAFYVETENNGIRIRRLKKKLGTKPLPTAELELDNVKGSLIGKEGRGTAVISTMLSITRIHNAVSAVSFMSRAIAIATAFAKVRKTFGRLLQDNALHVATLANLVIEFRVVCILVSLLGRVEHSNDPDAVILLRVFVPLVKAYVCKQALGVISECMEALGGIGYLENPAEINIARLLRDAQVLPIWEGTTNIQGDDIVRVFKCSSEGNRTLSVLQAFVESRCDAAHFSEWKELVVQSDVAALHASARDITMKLARIVARALLASHAAATRERGATIVAERYGIHGRKQNWREKFEDDKLLVFGPAEKAML